MLPIESIGSFSCIPPANIVSCSHVGDNLTGAGLLCINLGSGLARNNHICKVRTRDPIYLQGKKDRSACARSSKFPSISKGLEYDMLETKNSSGFQMLYRNGEYSAYFTFKRVIYATSKISPIMVAKLQKLVTAYLIVLTASLFRIMLMRSNS